MKYIIVVVLLALTVQTKADDYERRRNYDTFFLEAMTERQKEHHDAAFSLLTRCLEIDSMASEAYFFLAQYYTEMRQQDRALEFFRKASELEPANPTYMETLAQAYIGKERYADAVEVVEKLYESDKSRQALLQMLYNLHVQQHDYEKAVSVLDRMELIDGKSEQLSLSKSSLYIQMQRYDDALKEMKALSEQFPHDLNYRTIYATTLLMADNDTLRQEARKVLDSVLDEEPENYRAQLALRSYYMQDNDTVKADSLTRTMLLNPRTAVEEKVGLLRQVIGHNEQTGGDSTVVLRLFSELLDRQNPSADIAELCAAYMSLKQMPQDSIAKMLELVLSIAPDNASARLQLVQYAWDDQDDQRIVDLCQEARQYNPEEMAFYYYQGMAYYRQKDKDHALESFQNGISVINDDSRPAIVSDFYSVMGDLLYQKGRQQEAFAAYDSCLAWKPDNIGCLNNYAYYLSVLGIQLEKAEQMSRETIKAEPRNGTYLDTYAWILFKKEDYERARNYIDQAVINNENHSSDILEHAGDIYALCGDMEKALKYWEEALAGDTKNKTLKKKIKRKKYISK